MIGIREEYKQKKCTTCENKNKSITNDFCCIRVFQNGTNIYCKCTNQTSLKQEIKRKII